MKESPYGFALVIAEGRCLLGRLRASALEECDPGSTAEEVMETGPSTIRPDRELGALVKRLDERGLMFAIVTDPDGRLAGVVRRSEAEAFLSSRGQAVEALYSATRRLGARMRHASSSSSASSSCFTAFSRTRTERITVVVRRREERLGLTLDQCFAINEIEHANHQRVGVGAQPAHELAAHLQRGSPV